MFDHPLPRWYKRRIPRRHWFVENNCEQTFEKLFLSHTGKPRSYLEIGVWNGKGSLLWMIRNVLTNKDSWALGVDTWTIPPTGRAEQSPKWNPDNAYATATSIASLHHRCALTRGDSHSVMASLPRRQFDFVFIDGDHSPVGALRDLVAAFPLVKIGGIIVCDNMARTKTHDVSVAVDAFMDCHWWYVNELDVYSQQWACVKNREHKQYHNGGRRAGKHVRHSDNNVPSTRDGWRHL
jgi:hypothetical protein